MCVNHLKILTSQKLHNPLCLFGLKSFHGFIFVWRTEPSDCLVFYLVIKIWENLYKKPYQTWKTVKTFKKTSKCSNRNTQKEKNIIS